jgi:uncharacterized protein YbjT (DUF2867 family)
MKIVVIGGSGLIGKKLVNNLRQHGHDVVTASPSSVSTTSPARDWVCTQRRHAVGARPVNH